MILFTAAKEDNIQDGGLVPNNPELRHTVSRLKNHVERNSGTRVNKPKSPYISCAETIEAPVLKYSYGVKREISPDDPKAFTPRRNERRARIFIISFDESEIPEEKDVDAQHDPDDGPLYYRSGTYEDKLMPSARNFTNADREVLIYGKVGQEHVHEVHPVLADILFLLSDKLAYKPLYDQIIQKIVSGEYSIENFNKILDEFYFCSVDQRFVDTFYKDRSNIADSCEQALDMIKYSDDPSTRDDELVFYGTCLRNRVIKGIFGKLMDRDFEGKHSRAINEDFIPIEEYIHMTAVDKEKNDQFTYRRGKITIGDFTGDRSKENARTRSRIPLPYDMYFEFDDAGKVVTISTISQEVIKKYGEGTPEICTWKGKFNEIWRDERFVGRVYTHDDLSNPVARVQRENYVMRNLVDQNAINDGLTFRTNPDDPNQVVTFDEEGYVIYGIVKGKTFQLIDFLRDEEGNKTKFDNHGRGTDRQGYDREGMRGKLDRRGADKSGADKHGLPSGLTEEEARKMSQADLDNRFRACMENYTNANQDDLEFKTSPVERLIDMYISMSIRPNISKSFIYNKMMMGLFNKKIEPQNMGRASAEDVALVDKLIRSAMRVATECSIDVRKLIEDRIDLFIKDQTERTERAIILRGESSKIVEQMARDDEARRGYKQKIIEEHEEKFKDEMDGL